ncbi:tRNA pseudouridine(38-40) synthase TruA [Francisella adeliensis]|uniref:tRNA pseudouridine synthase A n=1 Tax=Francisella adeliensis TaxID=2007306 RepID=A0A2Z4XX87_9GAMM|nr:tRNA pseudouridine(38-40) synthase TruA [Francisella adeliensis]AXA33491.1 tRNA pseudouridine(38-40) synthase TruA [Francisella adeliensis]MBK2084811.1 tRNA pseudouridine(38-40) synthase TruA [Francisella adeliensis]MBK2097246.1 tRNA pseudouridine(38-40) synthase TruA [Francisella adeliensis]QIW11722.1 tRNA pseudouridine(38-40) synthase TruA [Francisella adeliensis]QIW13596.1 tRNA pseudouridine(38-40) synthase TruA [Francisella adeliensis]
MKNYLLQVEYFGKDYCGWQRQSHSPSIQEELEKALSKVANHHVEVICAGRTDTGVHATSQVVNFLSDANRDVNAWHRGVNALLPQDIKVHILKEVSLDFHARFSALNRTYNYVLYNAPTSSPIFANHSLWERNPLDIEKMNEACKHLIGEQDFSSFRSSQCQANTPFRNIQKAEFVRYGSFIVFEVVGNAFLHHMIRNLIGSFLKVGLGLKEPSWIQQLLEYKDRTKAAETAKAHGLYFVGVEYEGNSFYKSIKGIFSVNT